MIQPSAGARTPSRSRSAASDSKAELRRTIADFSRIQVAGLLAGAGLLQAWIDLAAGFGERVAKRSFSDMPAAASSDSEELSDRGRELLGEYERYVRELTQLPRIHGLRFYAELQRIREESRTT